MTDATRFQAAEELADKIAELIGGHSLDIACSALSLALAGAVAGYPLRERDKVEGQVTTMLHMRLRQMHSAGVAASRRQQ